MLLELQDICFERDGKKILNNINLISTFILNSVFIKFDLAYIIRDLEHDYSPLAIVS